MTYYKAFDENLCCRKLQFNIGETTSVEGDIEMCKNGIHCCKHPIACRQYYPRNSRFCEVTPVGKMLTDGNKTVCEGITVIKEITGEDLSDLLSGLYEERFWDGQLSLVGTYKDGKLEGQRKIWYKNGQLGRECTYKDGKRDGPCKDWHENGQLWKEFSCKDDKLDGLYKDWYGDGQLWRECTYKDGELEGLYKCWYGNGQLLIECTYKDGKKDGTHKAWHTYSDQLFQEFHYEDGRIKSMKEWNENGRPVVDRTYKDKEEM